MKWNSRHQSNLAWGQEETRLGPPSHQAIRSYDAASVGQPLPPGG
jgi:hypothetical protein